MIAEVSDGIVCHIYNKASGYLTYTAAVYSGNVIVLLLYLLITALILAISSLSQRALSGRSPSFKPYLVKDFCQDTYRRTSTCTPDSRRNSGQHKVIA